MINKIHTACKTCIFAQYQENTQTDCKLQEIAKFKKHGVEILEVFDDEKEFYVINKTKCLKLRQPTWDGVNLSPDEQIDKINKEIAIRYQVIIFANNNLSDIKKTLDSIYNQKLLPQYVTIVHKKANPILPSTISKLFRDDIKWRIENIVDDYTDEQIIDFIVPMINLPVYAIFYAGFEVPPPTMADINDKIHNEFFKFAILLPNSTNNGMVTMTYLHKVYSGSFGKKLITKLEEEKCPYLLPITQILSYFPK